MITRISQNFLSSSKKEDYDPLYGQNWLDNYTIKSKKKTACLQPNAVLQLWLNSQTHISDSQLFPTELVIGSIVNSTMYFGRGTNYSRE